MPWAAGWGYPGPSLVPSLLCFFGSSGSPDIYDGSFSFSAFMKSTSEKTKQDHVKVILTLARKGLECAEIASKVGLSATHVTKIICGHYCSDQYPHLPRRINGEWKVLGQRIKNPGRVLSQSQKEALVRDTLTSRDDRGKIADRHNVTRRFVLHVERGVYLKDILPELRRRPAESPLNPGVTCESCVQWTGSYMRPCGLNYPEADNVLAAEYCAAFFLPGLAVEEDCVEA